MRANYKTGGNTRMTKSNRDRSEATERKRIMNTYKQSAVRFFVLALSIVVRYEVTEK